MKKRLVAYLMVSALAVSVLAGCGGKGGDAGDAADAGTGEAAVVEEAVEETEVVEDASAALTAAIEEAAAVADTGAAIAADTAAEAAVEEYVDDEVIEEAGDAATDAAAAVDAAADKADYLTFEPGTQYTVVYGADVFASPDNTVPAIDELIPGYQLQINERLDDFWYNVSYIIDGVTRNGYIQIERTE